MSKKCQVCGCEIPDDFVNELCMAHYANLAEENELKKKEAEEEIKKSPDSAVNPNNIPPVEPINQTITPPSDYKPSADFGIKDPAYKENPEMEDKNQILANLAQFVYSHDENKGRPGKLLWYPTRNMYTFIKNYCMGKVKEHPQFPKYIWKPKIVDVGCGSGVGSNILSQEADFVWGIDKNKWSIEFAKEAFERVKNGIYYNSQVSFDVMDIMTENRTLMNFDVVVAIEIIEHIYDTNLFLAQLIRNFTKRDRNGNPLSEWGTEFFISTPNRNSIKIKKDQPDNPFHTREWTAEEFFELLNRYFKKVEFLNNTGEPIDLHAKDDIILAKCSL